MTTWIFNEGVDIEETLLNGIEDKYLLPSRNPELVEYFMNGDKMSINISTREMEWEPLYPGEMHTSKLSLRLHQWFAKGIISPVNP